MTSSLTGLVIREPWIDMILAGRKIWELRSNATTRRGRIALIRKGSGRIEGVASLVDVLDPLDEHSFVLTREQHGVPAEEVVGVLSRGWRIPWVLADVQRLARSIPYTHRSGAVVWVNLSPEETEATLEQIGCARGLASRRPNPEAMLLVRQSSIDSDLMLEDTTHAATTECVIDDASHCDPASPASRARVPVAKDGSWFGPHLARRDGSYTIGSKGEEMQLASFEQALRHLEKMATPRWRRPNAKGNWGIVSGVEWIPQPDD